MPAAAVTDPAAVDTESDRDGGGREREKQRNGPMNCVSTTTVALRLVYF